MLYDFSCAPANTRVRDSGQCRDALRRFGARGHMRVIRRIIMLVDDTRVCAAADEQRCFTRRASDDKAARDELDAVPRACARIYADICRGAACVTVIFMREASRATCAQEFRHADAR